MNKRQKKERLKRLNVTKDEAAARRRLAEEQAQIAERKMRDAWAKAERRKTVIPRWRKRVAGREFRARNEPKTFTGEW